MIEQSPQPETFRDLQRQLTRMRLQVLISGSRLPNRLEGMSLHSANIDPDHPGRIRYSYRSPEYEQMEDSACLPRHAESPENH